MDAPSESVALAHSHLIVQHLLKQLELFALDREERDPRPEWLTGLVQRVAELFEPLTGVGRVGCECELTEIGWEARLFLGLAEIVGGKHDGQSRTTGFELDLVNLQGCFDLVDAVSWNVSSSEGEGGGSFLTVRGLVGPEPVCVKLYSRPPRDALPALRVRADGTVEEI